MSQLLPNNEHSWMTHVLSIHGTPFEQLCENYLRQSSDWTFKNSRYPVEFPPSYSPLVSQTKNSELDLWGLCQSSELRIELLVECKKNNPEYTDWVFFPTTHPISTGPSLRTIKYRPAETQGYPWEAHSEVLYLVPPSDLSLTSDGREVKGSYQPKWEQSQKDKKPLPKDFTKTSNAAITDAAYQIALATQALLHQERRNQGALALDRANPIPPWRHVFLPLIVTTANLWTCQFPVEKVNSRTGEIPFSEVQYKTHNHLFYTYSLPPILQFHPAEDRSAYRSDAKWEELARFSILVVQSAAFPNLLSRLSKMSKDDDGRLVLPLVS